MLTSVSVSVGAEQSVSSFEFPLVSVIVRSVGRLSLETALASIALQDNCRIEVLVVAASGGEHPSVPTRAGPHLVRLVASAVPLTRPIAANAGLDAASGDWITFLDDDDRLLPGHISGLVQAAERHSAKVVHSFARA